MSKIIIEMKRIELTSESTIGEFDFQGKHYYTIEDVVRAPGSAKVDGKTAIPAGTYQIIMNMSNRFKVIMPLLLNVPNFEGIRIHSGNTALDTEGCLILGFAKDENTVTQSRVACAAFYDDLENALQTQEVWISIS
jgi:hypothetical protein